MTRLCRDLNEWEMGELCRLLGLFNGMKPKPSWKDDWEWTISKKRRFTSKSFYLELVDNRSNSFPHNGIWIPGIPSKVAFFI